MLNRERYSELRRELDAEKLIQVAKEKSGLSDFGDGRFKEPLHRMLDYLAQSVDFHAQGLEGFKLDIVRWLVNRLRMQRDISLHPEILEEDVSDPIIVTGLGRSGTTKLHKMLSAPDDVQKTLFWRLWNPAPFTDAIPGRPDPRIAAAGSSHLISADNPVLDAAHHMEEQEVEEEWLLYLMTFEDWAWCQQFYSPPLFDWLMSRPTIETFRYVKTIFQYLQWQDGGKRNRPWVMKTIGYIANLDSLLACYPNATLVHSHRDPRDTIPSYAKFLNGICSHRANPVDLRVFGNEMQRTWSIAMDRYLEARDRLNLDGRILDVSYDQVRNDPMSVMREIYRRAGRKMSVEAEHKMASWHNSNEQHRYGRHEYSLEECGLSEASIDKAFGKYIHRHIRR